jgi:hypothetical protein
MPTDGVYERREITREEFVDMISRADTLESHIGYDATASHIKEISGREVSVNRTEATFDDKDTALIVSLKTRIKDPTTKTDPYFMPSIDDYKYIVVTYKEIHQ